MDFQIVKKLFVFLATTVSDTGSVNLGSEKQGSNGVLITVLSPEQLEGRKI